MCVRLVIFKMLLRFAASCARSISPLILAIRAKISCLSEKTGLSFGAACGGQKQRMTSQMSWLAHTAVESYCFPPAKWLAHTAVESFCFPPAKSF